MEVLLCSALSPNSQVTKSPNESSKATKQTSLNPYSLALKLLIQTMSLRRYT